MNLFSLLFVVSFVQEVLPHPTASKPFKSAAAQKSAKISSTAAAYLQLYVYRGVSSVPADINVSVFEYV